MSEQEGEVRNALIDAPGIVTQYREGNLALQLLLTVIGWLLLQQSTVLELKAWGEAPETLADYRKLGFSTVKEEISYRRNLA
ncbi:hypothetical protein [Ktedonobacter robiniae]|uniref:N-acetyltransferase domain-containing protein n=1 Tax=Ktedonobacter robiniae TaxID=2778365 RepID=A0ABQ3V4B4_9CHLR|nr:hypothetical protein [Ktedonobacter robiniae]GHO59763.1 hypothetical protein KSB_82380 [Ktedonobacter robiniae]